MPDPIPFAFLATFSAFVLLLLTSVSVPLVSTFYFLHSTIAGGVRYGLWGWCVDDMSACEGPQLDYTWDPNIIEWLTKTAVLYPIATVFTFLAVFVLVPLFCTRHKTFPSPFFSVFIVLAFLFNFVGYIFSVALFVVARNRFIEQGFKATFGPCFWMALAATLLNLLMILNTGCGTMCRGRYGRASHNVAYNV